ncbi:MAG: AAA family ATPase [Clostridia bacterium]|nr:AAA family ATPase [Clostridia bacterium]MBQ9785786.1 AAA family ATPase [Clostridia bacterium]
MIYVERFILPSLRAENNFISTEDRTCFHTFYPFNVFPFKFLEEIEFDGITMFYGGNGSGKSTLINVMARKMHAIRFSEFNGAPLFDRYVEMCEIEYYRYAKRAYVLTSDDVFDYALNARVVNEGIDEQRNTLFKRYTDLRRQAADDPEMGRLKNLTDYERWKEIQDILSPKRSQSSYVRERVTRDIDLRSNGETAMRYFTDRIDSDAVYFLDEPENSLSIELQIQLAEYIAATARATNSQFIIATHSPIFLAMKDAKIYNLDSSPAGECHWTELPNVRRYFDFFMEHREEFE